MAVFFRNSFTIRGNHELFPKMARAMKEWDRHYDCRAVLVATEKMAREGYHPAHLCRR